ncbi:MAG: hypothetical protein AAGF11_43005 [Myxococcota bacterium]
MGDDGKNGARAWWDREGREDSRTFAFVSSTARDLAFLWRGWREGTLRGFVFAIPGPVDGFIAPKLGILPVELAVGEQGEVAVAVIGEVRGPPSERLDWGWIGDISEPNELNRAVRITIDRGENSRRPVIFDLRGCGGSSSRSSESWFATRARFCDPIFLASK